MRIVLDDPEIRDLIASGEEHVLRSMAPVSQWAISAWCGAMGDRNPVYLDEAAAIEAGHGGIIAPPVMMHGFTLPTLLAPELDSPARRLRARVAALGFPGVAAVSYEQEYFTPIRIGDTLARIVTVGPLSEPKTTALGTGHFATTLHRITNQRDELVGKLMIRVYYYRAETGKARTSRPGVATDRDWPIALPPLEIPITATLVACGALASNDYEPVHHDAAVARSQGVRDIFMNILTSSGLATRYVTDWGGPETVVKRLAVRLHAPNCPGDHMTMTGVANRNKANGEEAIVRVSGTNSIGKHVEAEIAVAWPARQGGR